MKEKLFRVLHFFKLDALLLRVLERLLDGLMKKRDALDKAITDLIALHLAATEEPIIA